MTPTGVCLSGRWTGPDTKRRKVNGMKGKAGNACRWLLVSPLLVCAVALGVVVATPTIAQASTVTVPIAVAGAIRTAPTPLCVAGPLGAAVCGAAVVGGLLYMTRDSWLPSLKNRLNGGSKEQTDAGTGTCTMNVTAFGQAETPRMIIGNLLYAGCYSGSLYVSYSNVTCRDSSGQEVTNTGTTNPSNIATGQNLQPGQASFAYTVCGVGLELVSLTIWGRSSTQGTGPAQRVVVAYPESEQETTATATCKRASGTTFEVERIISGTSEKIDVPSCYATDQTSYATQIIIKGGREGSTPTTVATISSHPNVEDDYGDCFNELGLVCNVAVWINGVECTVGDAVCKTWQDYQTNHPQDVSCRFGAYPVTMSNCDVLRHAYLTTTIPVTTVDPTTGIPNLPNDPNGPNAPPEVCQVNCTTPPVPDDPENPEGGDGCLADAFSWNPVDWVYVPVKCALTWAFVPPSGSWDAAVDRVKVAAEGDSMAQWQDSLTGAFSGVSGGNAGCQGPGFSMPQVLVDGGMPSPFYPFSSCGSTASQVAYWSHLISTVFLVVLAVVKTVELVTSGMGLSSHVGIVRGHAWEENVRGEKF